MIEKGVSRIDLVQKSIILITERQNSNPYFTAIQSNGVKTLISGAMDSFKDYNDNLTTINRGIAIDLRFAKLVEKNKIETGFGNFEISRQRLKLIKYKLEQLCKN